MLLWNTGGGANSGNQLFGMELARRSQVPVAFLYHVPNQPLLDGKKEDALIAETFVRYLETKDEKWPLLFPMVKSVVRAMDAVQAFAQEEWKHPVKSFVVSGGSKRGWTSWLTAASGDRRVKAIAPVVIDTLNMRAQGPHQLASFNGKYSDMIRDYTARGLLPMPNTPEALKLWSMVDPWVYRDRLTLPKLLINGNNDPYWTTDALNLYWDDLKGDKWVLYVPNAGHNLQQKDKPLPEQMSYAVNGLAAFVKHQANGKPMPQLKWKHDDNNGKLRLTVESNTAPLGARAWVAQGPTRDLRQARWTDRPAVVDGGKVVCEIDPPSDGWLALFGELEFDADGLQYRLSTQIRMANGNGGK
jgi:PhoPQ-activated pathogenicity-related protein